MSAVKVSVDPDICGGHSDCVMHAPEVFDFRDHDDVVSVLLPEPPAELHDKVRKACATCPNGAITVEDD